MAAAARVVTGAELDEMEGYVESAECAQFVDQTVFGKDEDGGVTARSWGAAGRSHPERYFRGAARHAMVGVRGQGVDEHECRLFATDTHAEADKAPAHEPPVKRTQTSLGVAGGASLRTAANGGAAPRRVYQAPAAVNEYLDLY